MAEQAPGNRLDRRKRKTRTALIDAAQKFLAEGRAAVPILEITQAADVGMGSFYNHFESRDALFSAAIDEALERHGALMDELMSDIEDPAVRFAQSFRLTGRLHRREPQISRVLINNGLRMVSSELGLAPRALRDIEAGVACGRFSVADPVLALTIAAGAVLCLGQLLHEHPDRDDVHDSDQVAEDLLRMLGVPAKEAREICSGPVPEIVSATL